MNSLRNNKSGKILNVLLSIIAILVIIFVIFWIVNKGKRTNNNSVTFVENLNNIQDVAKNYFKDNLPDNIGEENTLTLNELYKLGLINTVTYNNKSCDSTKSYVSITKLNSTDYQVLTNLVCDGVSDNIIEKVKSNTVVKDNEGKIVADDSDNNTTIETNTDSNKKNVKTAEKCTSVGECEIYVLPSDCETTYKWEFVKKSAECPSGYEYKDGKCVKSYDTTKNPGTTIVREDAKVNTGKEYKVYTDLIINKENDYYKCTTGKLDGKYCYQYADKITEKTSKCPSGYSESGSTCKKYVAKQTTTSSSCPSGYSESGSLCKKYVAKQTTTSSSCPSGYTANGSYCYKYANLVVTTNTTYSCPNGYDKSGSQCYKYVSAVKSYTAWGNPTTTYSTKTYESPYTYDLEKKVLVGSNKIGSTTVYTYTIYNRSTYYSCASGSLSGTTCVISMNATANTTSSSSCPSGYTKDGNTCYVRTNKTSSTSSVCPSGSKVEGDKCYVTANKISSTSSVCPSGSKAEGDKCYVTAAKTTTTTTKCPTGYSESGDKCYIKSNATLVEGKTTTSCQTGYSKTSDGKKCYKTKKSSDTYYCEYEGAKLIGSTCTYSKPSTTCDAGYTYNSSDKLCHRSTSESVSASWNIVDRIYSSESYIDGYQKTGRGTYKIVCTPTALK